MGMHDQVHTWPGTYMTRNIHDQVHTHPTNTQSAASVFTKGQDKSWSCILMKQSQEEYLGPGVGDQPWLYSDTLSQTKQSWENIVTSGTGAVSDSFTDFWDPTSHTGSPCPALIHGKVLSLTETWYAVFYWYLPFPGWRQKRRGLGCRRGTGREGWVRGDCSQNGKKGWEERKKEKKNFLGNRGS